MRESDKIRLNNIIELKDLEQALRQVAFRGLYDERGEPIRPYANVRFSLTRAFPQRSVGVSPEVAINRKREPLFTAQPTIYQNQLDILQSVDEFLRREGFRINRLTQALHYAWEGRGEFHVLPPVIERHSYDLARGYLDLGKLLRRFRGTYVKDARGNLHHLGERYLNRFYIDELCSIGPIDIFNSNASILNYGLQQNGRRHFHIVCDGAHRVDYALERLGEPTSVIVVEPENEKKPLIPYYALPVPFMPAVRLSSKKAEKVHHRLERDKIHLFNDFIKKTLHYDWDAANLKVSKLRSNVDVH